MAPAAPVFSLRALAMAAMLAASLSSAHAAIFEDGEARRVLEALGLLAEPDHVGVLADHPERVDVVPLVPEERGVPAQPGPLAMRVAIALVVLRRGDVERAGVERGRHRGSSGETGEPSPAEFGILPGPPMRPGGGRKR